MLHAGPISYNHLLRGPDKKMEGPGRVHLSDARIARIEPDSNVGSADGGDILMPALCNAHDHGRGLRTVAFGAQDDTLETWISALSLEPKVDPYLRAAAAFGRLALSGVGVLNHCHNTQDPQALATEAHAVARAANDVGLRVAFAAPVFGHNPITYGDPEPFLKALPVDMRAEVEARPRSLPSATAQLDAAEEVFALASAHFMPQYGPVGPQWVDPGTLAEIATRSAQYGRRIHMHLLETRAQREWADAAFPGGLIPHLDDLGLLSARLTVAHGTWLRADECALLAARGVMVSVNTSSNLRLRSGIAPVADFVATGLGFGMGMDGMAFDDDEDALRELRLLWHLQRGFGVDDVLTPDALWRAVLSDGRAAILGDDGGGAVAPGAPADLLLLSTDRIMADTIPGRCNPLDLVLTRATKADVAGLWVAGRRIVAEGRCLGLDLPLIEAELLAQARTVAEPMNHAGQAQKAEAMRGYLRGQCHCLPGPASIEGAAR